MSESEAIVEVTVNQKNLIDKVLARYPEKFIVFRELIQNADDAGATSFAIEFQTPQSVDSYASNGTKPDLRAVQVQISKWLVKNNGLPFKDDDWSRLTKIAEGNPDEGKIGAFGVGFYSVFSVTDEPIVTSKGKMMTIFYKGGDQLHVKTEKCRRDDWTTIEMKLKQESPIPRISELAKFLVTSMTFLVNVKHITISLNDRVLSTLTRSRGKPDQSILIPDHMIRSSPEGNMSVNSVDVISQEVMVEFGESSLVGDLQTPITKVDSEESDQKPPGLPTFFFRHEQEVALKKGAVPGAATEAPSLKTGAQLLAKCCIYSANVTVSAKPDLKEGLEFAMKKKLPKDFLLQIVFFSKEEHNKQVQEGNKSGVGSVFYGPQGLCPPLQGEHGARIFIGQSTTQTTGVACHISGRFIPTVERGLIDLANGHVAKWNKELLYVGGFLARTAYESGMNKLRNGWSDAAQEQALYTIKFFTFHPSTPNSMVSNIIQDAFFRCSKENDFPMVSNKGIRHTKEIRQFHADFAPFMQGTPVLDVLDAEIAPMIKVLPDELRIRTYTFQDVVDELKSRCLMEVEMAACLSWWTNKCGSQGPLSEKHKQIGNDLLKFGRTFAGGKEIKLSAIRTFIDRRMLSAFSPDDPLPEDTIPSVLIGGIDPLRIQRAFGWQEMPIAHWLQHIMNMQLDQKHEDMLSPDFVHILTILSKVWNQIPPASHTEILHILEGVACIPTTSSGIFHLHKPKEAYFPEANAFRDLPVVIQNLLAVPGMKKILEYFGVRKRLSNDNTFMTRVHDDKWDALDLARYFASTHLEHANHIMGLDIFPCSDGKRRRINELYVSTDLNHQLGLPLLLCNKPDSTHKEAIPFLVRHGLREYPNIEELIHIATKSDARTREIAFSRLCEPLHETELHSFDLSKFSSYAFIPGIRNGEVCLMSHEEVFSDPSWAILGLGKISNTEHIRKLKIRDHPSAAKLIQVLQSNPPKDEQTATEWFQFLADRRVFSAGEFDKIAGMKIVPVLKVASGQQGRLWVSPRECFLKLDEDLFYLPLLKSVDFGLKANGFLRACHIKQRPECIDIINVLLDQPERFYELAVDHERYMAELRIIAVGYKSLPPSLCDKMRNARIFLGFRRRSDRERQYEYKLCNAKEVLVADDMESCRTFGHYIFIAPQEELLERFYSRMGVESLSSCIQYNVNPRNELPETQSPHADQCRKSIIDRIPIFLHDFEKQRFREGMYLLPWDDKSRFLVRACRDLHVTKNLEFKHAPECQGRETHKTQAELTAETQRNGDINVLWMKEPKADSYDIAAALCRMLFSTYKKNDVLSLMTILDTPEGVLVRRGYDVDRILKDYKDRLQKSKQDTTNSNVPQAPTENTPVNDEQGPSKSQARKKGWFDGIFKRSGEIKMSNSQVDDFLQEVENTIKTESVGDDGHTRNRQVRGGNKQRDVHYCDEKQVAETDLEACPNLCQANVQVWRHGTILESEIPSDDCKAFVDIISNLATVFNVNQTRCNVFYHKSDSSLMGFNRNNRFFFGLKHYIEKHRGSSLGKAHIDWYYVMAHEIAHVHTPYHDEHHELMFAALTTKYLDKLHNLRDVQEFLCV